MQQAIVDFEDGGSRAQAKEFNGLNATAKIVNESWIGLPQLDDDVLYIHFSKILLNLYLIKH